jgi:hypothetical protein
MSSPTPTSILVSTPEIDRIRNMSTTKYKTIYVAPSKRMAKTKDGKRKEVQIPGYYSRSIVSNYEILIGIKKMSSLVKWFLSMIFYQKIFEDDHEVKVFIQPLNGFNVEILLVDANYYATIDYFNTSKVFNNNWNGPFTYNEIFELLLSKFIFERQTKITITNAIGIIYSPEEYDFRPKSIWQKLFELERDENGRIIDGSVMITSPQLWSSNLSPTMLQQKLLLI